MGLPKAALRFWTVGVHAAQMMVEAQTVMALRLLGFAGIWSTTPAGAVRMVLEKPSAFIRAAASATEALMSGKRPDHIVGAAIRLHRPATDEGAWP